MNSVLYDSNTTTELNLFCFLLQATFVNLCETSPGYQFSIKNLRETSREHLSDGTLLGVADIEL